MRRILPIIAAVTALCILLAACGASKPATTAAPEPSPEPTEAPASPTMPERDALTLRAEEILADMNLSEKLCQLMIVRPEILGAAVTEAEADATQAEAVTRAGESIGAALAKYPVGGVIFGAKNLLDMEQTKAMTAGFQGDSGIPLFISADEEGGRVSRLMSTIGTTWFNAMYTYRDQGVDTARENACTIGGDMLSCGFNTDFAPVADVWTNPDNSVIGDRAYSDDYGEAAELVAAAVEGFRQSGCVCCLKHFPGHGDTAEDTHDGPAILNKDLDELMAGELQPFIAGIGAGADMVMIGHMTLPQVDDGPAGFSYRIVTELLRRSLGYDGVVVTDGLDMGALSQYSEGEKCLKALSAGCDIMLGVADIPSALGELTAAVSDGSLSEQRIDESVKRILMLKLEKGIMD